MEIVKVIGELPNKVGVQYPEIKAKNEQEEDVVTQEKTIQIFLKTGFESFMASQGDLKEIKGAIPYHLKGKALAGKVYKVEALDENADAITLELHESQIPTELLKKKEK